MTFTAMPASETGLVNENPYDDPAMWAERYTEFQGGSVGTGIAVGDLDGDGLVDIFVCNKTRPNKLFKQVAPFKFVDITEQAGVGGPAAANGIGWKTGVTLADVNNDGFLDIYVCRFNAPNLLYINDGHGHFTEEGHKRGVDLVSGSVVGAFEDYDRDGHLDLFVVTNIQDAKRSPMASPTIFSTIAATAPSRTYRRRPVSAAMRPAGTPPPGLTTTGTAGRTSM